MTLFNINKSLFEQICSYEQLLESFKAVKRNKGAPGIDGKSIEEYEKNLVEELGQLEKELNSWSYQPMAVKRIELAKPDGGLRLLGIPCIRDRVVQASIKSTLEPIFERQFSEHNFGFRPGRSQKQALATAQEIAKSGKEFVVDIDLSKFFDRVNQDRLIHRLSLHVEDNRVLRLIGLTLRSGVMINGVVHSTEEGTTQGSPLSPLLSNVVLDELDKELEKRGLEYCRWADDCNIFVRSEKAALRVMTSISKYIENRLKLKVNQEKSKVARTEFVKFLGMTLLSGTLIISNVAMSKAMNKVKEITPRGTSETIEQTMEKFNSWYRGWSNYFSMTQYPSQLHAIEAHARRRLRCRIVTQQKRQNFLLSKLMSRGIKKSLAMWTVYSNRRQWALSHTMAVERAYSNAWFEEKLGMVITSKNDLPHWFGLNVWTKPT